MMRPRWQKVLSDLWKNKSRSLLTIASIAVGLLGIGVVTKLYFMMNQDMSAGYARVNPANIQIQTDLFDHDFVKHIQRIEGVNEVDAAREFSMQILTSSGNWNPISIQSKDYDSSSIDHIAVLEGTFPAGKGQIVLANNNMRDLDIKVGDYVTLMDAQGDQFQLQVAGIVQDQMIGSASVAGGFFAADEQGYVSSATVEKLHVVLPKMYNVLYITTTGDATDLNVIREVGDRVRHDLEDNGYSIYRYSTAGIYDHPNKGLVNAIVVVLLMLTFLIVFLSGFLITNTLQFLINQQIEQVGIMKSVGATRRQIVQIYMALIAVFGLIAFAIAVPITNAMTDTLMVYLSEKVNFVYFGRRVNLAVLFIQITLAMVVPQFASIFPILKGTRISVQEALSGIQQQTITREWAVERVIAGLRRITRPVKIALRNVFRNKGRLILTIITISLGGAVFISVFNSRVSFSGYISQLSHYFMADLNITLSRARRVDEVEQVLNSDPDVKSVEAWNAVRVPMVKNGESTGYEVNLMIAPNDTQLVKPILISGRWLDPRDQNAIALNDSFHSQFPDVQIGDTISLKINDRDTEWQVVGFFQMAGKLGGLIGYVNQDYYSSLPGQVQNKALVFRVAAKDQLSAAQQKEFSIQIQALLESRNIDVSGISTGSRITESATDGFNILTTVLLILAILIALVGSIGLTGTMSMNVMERTREIGIMRAIGASDRVLMKMVMIEGVVIGWISWILGAILSIPISLLLSNSITLALFGASTQLGFSLTGFLIWFVVDTGLSILASITPARTATRLTIREVLSYE